jgi:catechol 2,3-dioxygenase-like lactoylglutathione lyase family enzyme
MKGTKMNNEKSAGKTAVLTGVDMKLEVVFLGVSDIDRAKAFYENLGWRLDADFANGDFHAVQVTPRGSGASIIFGKGIPSPRPGSATSLVLAVGDINAAHADLIARGVNASEVFHYAGGPFNTTGENPRVSGRDPEGRSYYSFVSFEDPDGNGWLLQEITTRLPGRVDRAATTFGSASDLASAFRRTEAAHGEHEKRTGGQRDANWPDWYAEYMVAEQAGTALPQ